MSLEQYLRDRRRWVEDALESYLPRPDGPGATVHRAMRYAVFGGGKRLRPVLAAAACEACGGERETVRGPAAALEMIHTYSLIHDDLPAMDDDDLRRGRATVHKVFGEAEAILAGDGLLTLAFQVLAAEPPGDAAALRRTLALETVSRAAGAAGMVGGQMADLEAERGAVGNDGLEWIHLHKTAALLSASLETGAIHAGAPDDSRKALAAYGVAIGLAFQIADDILDVTSTSEDLGKTPGKDARSGKATYPALYGLEQSKQLAAGRVEEALDRLKGLPRPAAILEDLARFVVERTS